MKLKTLLGLSMIMLTVLSCKKDDNETEPAPLTYSDLKSFHQQHDVPSQHFTSNAATGSTLIASGGTVVTIPPYAFKNSQGIVTSGTVEIELREIYSTLDMLLTDMPTVTIDGQLLKSGGEIFIKAEVNGESVEIADSAFIDIALPADSIDQDMQPFVWVPDTFISLPQPPLQTWAWSPWFSGFLTANVSTYVLSLYQFSVPVSSGTWCNCDNPYYFNGPQAVFTVNTSYDPDTLETEVFMVFPESNSVVHVYRDYLAGNFPYNFAPVGKECVVVGIATINGKLHSSFTTVTVGNNTIVTLDLKPTTFPKFKEDYQALM